MTGRLMLLLPGLMFAVAASGQDSESDAAATATIAEAVDESAPTRDDPDQPRAMSGMSILGNEEAPKSLVIVPWKSSELGDEIGLSEQLDDRANPVDRDVFLRELRYYEIRETGE